MRHCKSKWTDVDLLPRVDTFKTYPDHYRQTCIYFGPEGIRFQVFPLMIWTGGVSSLSRRTRCLFPFWLKNASTKKYSTLCLRVRPFGIETSFEPYTLERLSGPSIVHTGYQPAPSWLPTTMTATGRTSTWRPSWRT